MDKRGVSLLFAIFSFAASIMIIVVATRVAKTVATGEDIQQSYLAKDSALMIDAYHAVSGDVNFNYRTFNYSENLKMSIFEDNSVQVVPELGSSAVYPFRTGLPKLTMDEINIDAYKLNIVEFSKNDSKIEIKKKVEE